MKINFKPFVFLMIIGVLCIGGLCNVAADEEISDIETVYPVEITADALFEKGSMPERGSRSINNVIAGIAKFNLGPGWSNFSFDIDAGTQPQKAVVMIGLLNIYNRFGASDLQYKIDKYDVTYHKNIVRVSGKIYIGDSDGYLHGLSYNCTVF